MNEPTDEQKPETAKASETPRTDAEFAGYPILSNDHFQYEVVRKSFARQLERELAKATKERDFFKVDADHAASLRKSYAACVCERDAALAKLAESREETEATFRRYEALVLSEQDLRAQLAEEQKAHELIGSLCAAAGISDPDGTSIGCVKAALAQLAAARAESNTLNLMMQKWLTELDSWWSFGSGQQHTHNWHDKQDFLEARRKELAAIDSAKEGR